MADPIDPIPSASAPPPPPPPLPTDADPKSGTTGLPSNVAAMLACLPLVGGIIFYLLEKRDGLVRFYAMQSIIYGGAYLLFLIVFQIAYAILRPIPVVGILFGALLWGIWFVAGVAFLVILVVAMVKAYSGVRWDVPYVGPIARKQTGDTTS